MSNPFHTYHFQRFPFTIQYMNAGVLSRQRHTTRCPNAKLVDNVAVVNQGLSSYGSLKDRVVRIFIGLVHLVTCLITEAYQN